jgi:hypothetical protein
VWPGLQALNNFIAVLREIPPDVIAAEHISSARPSRANDLPHVTVTGREIKESPVGIGGILLEQKSGEEEIRKVWGQKVAMTYRLDIWADSIEQVERISQGVTQFLFEKSEEMRGGGFIRLSLDSIGEIATTSLRRLIGSTTAYRRRLEYKGIYEQITSQTIGGGGIIKTIDVEIDEQLRESMEIS